MENRTFTTLSTVSVFVFALLFTHTANAQRTPLACQVDAAGGLKWESGRWGTAKFTEMKFILVQDGPSLTAESAAKAMLKTAREGASCKVTWMGLVSCTDDVGGFLLFNLKTKRGTIAQTIGNALSDGVRDSLSVEAFSCQTF